MTSSNSEFHPSLNQSREFQLDLGSGTPMTFDEGKEVVFRSVDLLPPQNTMNSFDQGQEFDLDTFYSAMPTYGEKESFHVIEERSNQSDISRICSSQSFPPILSQSKVLLDSHFIIKERFGLPASYLGEMVDILNSHGVTTEISSFSISCKFLALSGLLKFRISMFSSEDVGYVVECRRLRGCGWSFQKLFGTLRDHFEEEGRSSTSSPLQLLPPPLLDDSILPKISEEEKQASQDVLMEMLEDEDLALPSLVYVSRLPSPPSPIFLNHSHQLLSEPSSLPEMQQTACEILARCEDEEVDGEVVATLLSSFSSSPHLLKGPISLVQSRSSLLEKEEIRSQIREIIM